MTKQEMINEKHHIYRFNIFFTRLIIFILLVISFYYLPDPLKICLKFFGFDEEKIKNHKLELDLIASKMIITIVYVSSLISYRIKHFLNMLILVSLIVFIIIHVLKDVAVAK